MTESEAIKVLDGASREDYLYQYDSADRPYIVARAERMAISALEEVQQYRAIGTVEEFRELKEKRDCKDCANTADKAIDDFAKFIHEKAKEHNGLRLSSETRSWTHASIFDYVDEFKKQHLDWSEGKEQA